MGRNPPAMKLKYQNETNAANRREQKREMHRKSAQAQAAQVKKSVTEVKQNILYPAADTAFKALLSARFCAAIWSHISDCDETYNYWEPMHYLVFGKGLQTWEYSPEFALRSYTYLLMHAVPAFIYHRLFQPNPLLIFYLIRCVLAFLCAVAEVSIYKAICREFGVNVGRMWLAFQIFSAGMFTAGAAFLPSTFAMYTTAGACACWWKQKYALAILNIAIGALLGWPFAAVLGVPIAYDLLIIRKDYKLFINWAFISFIIIMLPSVLIDSSYYGKLVVAPWNIVKYNVLGGGGPNLYGTEPFSFYLINGFLNFNFIWIFALLCPIFVFIQYAWIPAKTKSTLTLPYYVSLAPLYLWLAIFMIQPHKEERFLFPVYPLISLCGAITVDILQKVVYRIWCLLKNLKHGGMHYLDFSASVMVAAVIITSLLGLSRIFALYNNYHAPLDLLMELNRYSNEGKISPNVAVNVCLGKEWHRFPSSFFLPDNNWNVRFIQSEFKGILPAPYAETENGTTIIHSHFNDQNREEPSIYYDVNKCHFLLDLDTGTETPLEPIYSHRKDRWKVVKWLPFLIAERSHRFFRAFYIPFISDKFVVYGNYTLLQTVGSKRTTIKI